MCLECGSGISRGRFLRLGAGGVGVGALLGVGGEAWAAGSGILSEFGAASRRYGVPEELLLAIGYVNSLWEMPPRRFGRYRPGDVHGMGGYGVMGLRQDPRVKTLAEASRITGFSREALETNRRANILGGAAVLSRLARGRGAAGIEGWYRAVSAYGGSPLYAEEVYEILRRGVVGEADGRRMAIPADPRVREAGATYSPQAAGDYAGSTWYGASSSNFTTADRPKDGLDITTIVVHVTQGSWASAINWFKDPNAQVSAHYVIRSKDGYVAQSVREKNIAWHAANWNYNQHSIGIEHEGYINDPKWFTDAMYRSSARLVAHLCRKYHIPIDRKHIIGHNQVPGADHRDPGPYWNWKKYMRYVRHYAGAKRKLVYQQVVDNASGRFQASKNWYYNTWNKAKYGRNYRAARPKAVSDPANFYMKVPVTADYVVYARWPASSSYNSRTPILIRTTSGFEKVVVNQRRHGGRWVKLGTFRMPKGNKRAIKISRWTSGRGWVIADAVMIRRYG